MGTEEEIAEAYVEWVKSNQELSLAASRERQAREQFLRTAEGPGPGRHRVIELPGAYSKNFLLLTYTAVPSDPGRVVIAEVLVKRKWEPDAPKVKVQPEAAETQPNSAAPVSPGSRIYSRNHGTVNTAPDKKSGYTGKVNPGVDPRVEVHDGQAGVDRPDGGSGNHVPERVDSHGDADGSDQKPGSDQTQESPDR